MKTIFYSGKADADSFIELDITKFAESAPSSILYGEFQYMNKELKKYIKNYPNKEFKNKLDEARDNRQDFEFVDVDTNKVYSYFDNRAEITHHFGMKISADNLNNIKLVWIGLDREKDFENGK